MLRETRNAQPASSQIWSPRTSFQFVSSDSMAFLPRPVIILFQSMGLWLKLWRFLFQNLCFFFFFASSSRRCISMNSCFKARPQYNVHNLTYRSRDSDEQGPSDRPRQRKDSAFAAPQHHWKLTRVCGPVDTLLSW